MMYASSRRCGWSLRVAEALYTVRLIVLLVGGVLASSGDCVLAQIIPDGTLPNNSVVTLSGNTNLITGGTTAGSNLFHSFQQFSVPTGGTAYFNNTLEIQNIITRVTGSSISNIDGKLQANGTANLFLLNPNGIIFSRNASLNIGGSFLASTASSLNFADGTQFGATTPQTTQLLTISVPIGLQFVRSARSIVNQSQATSSSGELVGLAVQSGKTLALVGGDIAIEGGRLTAAGGRMELGSVADTSLVRLNPTAQGWVLGYEGVQNFKDIQLSQQAVVDASGERGGNIQVRGRRVTLTDGSQIVTVALESEPRGKLNVNASDSIELTVYPSRLSSDGDLTIHAGDLSIRNGAKVVVFSERLLAGEGGNIETTARNIFLDNQGAIEAAAESSDGSNITLQVQNLLLMRRASFIGASAYTPRFDSKGGNVTIDTKLLVVIPSENSDIVANAFGGQGGRVQIVAQAIFGSQVRNSLSPLSDIARSTEIEANTNPNLGLAASPVELVDASRQIAQNCPARGSRQQSSFTITGVGGLPTRPGDLMNSPFPTGTVRVIPSSSTLRDAPSNSISVTNSSRTGQVREALATNSIRQNEKAENPSGAASYHTPTTNASVPLVEAQGWVYGSNGEVILTAQAPTINPHDSWSNTPTCH